MLWVVVVLVFIFLLGHYGLPEEVNPHAFQEMPAVSQLMRGAEPFRLTGQTEVGFLLVHGFEDSPYIMRNLANLLHSEGHTVIAPLLPGHGTNIKAFERTRYEHWRQMVLDTYLRERPRFKYFFMIGFSMGGNLTLNVASRVAKHAPPTGVITIAAPVTLNGFLNGRLMLHDPRLFFTGILKYFVRYIPKSKGALTEKVMVPWVGYEEAYTLAPLHSFKRGVSEIKHRLYRIVVPTCLIHAQNDKTVDVENMHYIFRRIRSPEKCAYVINLEENLSTHHVLVTHQIAREKVFHYIIKFVHDTLRGFDLKPALFKTKGDKKSWLQRLKRVRTIFEG
ncbi:MAG TPA: alpha/beta fold hydrolase [Turneriella sp.]|nr:alpha/beta fold hydrolase [Turneriella sp.]